MTSRTKEPIQLESNGELQTTKKEVTKLSRFLWTTGGKGGVGKSTAARGLYDLFLARSIQVAAFDGDKDTSQLYRYYKDYGVTRLNIDNPDSAGKLVDVMDESKPDIVLVDVAAGGSKSLAKLEADQRILSDAAEMGYRVTVISVISRIKDSVNLLQNTLSTTANHDVDHVIFKNLYFGESNRFVLFDESKTKAELLERGGIVLDMPDLYDTTYELLDKGNLPFGKARKRESGLARQHRSRVHQWMERFEAQAAIAGERFGL